jgi:geranylgeranyl diphosphate synthase type I
MESVEQRRNRIEAHLEAVLSEMEPTALREQMREVVLSGGKRIRPTLTALVCDALDGDVDLAVEFAVGIELVHNASLVVDDIIDQSALRRSDPSAWTAFGHGPAIVTSDGLLGEAFDLFTADNRAIETVSEALVQLGQGEASELLAKPTTESGYMQLARRKTGALFRAAAELGAIAADADPETVDAVGQYAERVGIAFQIRDDVLDATADSDRLGKPSGRDADLGRPSIFVVTDLSVAGANERARDASGRALDALDAADLVDSRAETYLTELASFAAERKR